MSDDTPAVHHDDTDVPAALQRETHDGPGEIPDGPGDYEEGDN